MKENITINRDSIYVGSLERILNIEDYDLEAVSKAFRLGMDKSDYPDAGLISLFYRTILFTLDDHNYSHDLLYDAPNYPVLHYTDIKEIQNKKAPIVIKNACNLSDLLKRFGYADKENLTYQDIVDIKNRFFNGKFFKENIDSFTLPVVISNKIYEDEVSKGRCFAVPPRTLIQKLSYIKAKIMADTYIPTSQENYTKEDFFKNMPLFKYGKILNKLSNDDLMAIFDKGLKVKFNVFKPVKDEGKVKKKTNF